MPEEVRSGFTLMKESRSSQGANLEFPRAILFGKDAKFLVAFNGSEKQRGFDKLETITFDAHQGFQFREILFSRDGKTAPQVSAVNPQRCLNCHGTPPRPIWSSYSLWPGAFGFNEDRLSDDEAAALSRWKENRPRHPRYSEIEMDEAKNPAEPFYLVAKWRKLAHMPNLRLSQLLARLDAQAMAERLRQTGHAVAATDLALFWHLGCDQTLEGAAKAASLAAFDKRTKALEEQMARENPFVWNTVLEMRGIPPLPLTGYAAPLPHGLAGLFFYDGFSTKQEILLARLVVNARKTHPTRYLGVESLIVKAADYYGKVEKGYATADYVALLDEMGTSLPHRSYYYGEPAKRATLMALCAQLEASRN